MNNNTQQKLIEFKIAIAPYPFDTVHITSNEITVNYKNLSEYIIIKYNPLLEKFNFNVEYKLNTTCKIKVNTYCIEEVISNINYFFNTLNANSINCNVFDKIDNPSKENANVDSFYENVHLPTIERRVSDLLRETNERLSKIEKLINGN